MIGDPSEQDLIAFSPSRSVETIRAPILLIHATNDTVVPPSQSRNLAQLLKQRGKAHEFIELPGEDHWLSSGSSRLTVLQTLETFLATHLRRLPGKPLAKLANLSQFNELRVIVQAVKIGVVHHPLEIRDPGGDSVAERGDGLPGT